MDREKPAKFAVLHINHTGSVVMPVGVLCHEHKMNLRLRLRTVNLMKYLVALCCISGIGFFTQVAASDYQNLLDQALANCEEIDSHNYQTGLWLNPDGYRSYYEKSACIQRAAIAFRAPSLCNKVKCVFR